ncbi:MAG: hypothetical protein EBZ13_05160 [Planctomycetia bacterium]|nr:hypothetical protein [Planctomycetia bacterium]
MPSLAEIDRMLAPHHLSVFGGFHPGAKDGTPEGCETLLMLGPREPGFWAHVTAEAEHFHRQVVPAMQQLRETADRMEVLLPDDLWPLPTYAEILFIK